MIVGEPVWQVKELQDMIKAGEVLVSSKAWSYVNESGYVHLSKDHKSVKVTGFKEDFKGGSHQQAAAFNFIQMTKPADPVDGLDSASATLLSPSLEAFGYGNAVDQSQNFSCKNVYKISVLL